MEGSLPKQQSFIIVDLLSQIFEEKFLQELPLCEEHSTKLLFPGLFSFTVIVPDLELTEISQVRELPQTGFQVEKVQVHLGGPFQYDNDFLVQERPKLDTMVQMPPLTMLCTGE